MKQIWLVPLFAGFWFIIEFTFEFKFMFTFYSYFINFYFFIWVFTWIQIWFHIWVHNLIQKLAESRLKSQGLRSGQQRNQQELGVIVGQIRWRLSMAAVKSQVNCLLSRIHQVGPGNAQAARRRDWALQEDDRMQKERSAQWLLKYEGVRTLAKGHIKTA